MIDPLLQAPQQAAPQQAAPLRRRAIAPAGVLQRKPKYDQPPPKFTDPFSLTTWRAKQKKLRGQIERPGGGLKTQLTALELFEEAQDAETARAAVPQAGPSTLPSKAQAIDVVSAADPAKKQPAVRHPHTVSAMLGWLKHWTSLPAEILGVFRAAFGTAFVKIAHFVSGFSGGNLLTKIKTGIQKLFNGVKFPGGNFGALVKEGLAKALGMVGDLLLPSVFRMVAGAVKTGVGKALTELFGGDLVQEALDKFQQWKTLLETIEQKVTGVFSGVLKFVEDVVAVIKKGAAIVDAVNRAKRAIQIGIRLAECSGVYTCVVAALSLVVDVDDKIIGQLKDKILSACNVRSLMAGAVRRLLIDVPAKIANGILGLVHDIVPDALGPLKTVFSVKVQPEPVPELKEMEDTDCWGIDLGFSLFDEGFSHPDTGDGKGTKDKGAKDTKDTKGTRRITKAAKPSAPPPPASPPPAQSKTGPTKQSPGQGPSGSQPAVALPPWDPSALSIWFSVKPPDPAPGTSVSSPLYVESSTRTHATAENRVETRLRGRVRGDRGLLRRRPSRQARAVQTTDRHHEMEGRQPP